MSHPSSSFDLPHLDKILQTYYDEKRLTKQDGDIRRGILTELTSILQKNNSGVQLNLFGSSANGFGVKDCDLDIYADLWPGTSKAKNLDWRGVQAILQSLDQRLTNSQAFTEIQRIPSVNVPIVRFLHRATNLRGDISLSNAIGVENTALLKAYADIDERVQVLVCFLKKMAKICDIANPACNSLSSFAYAVLMIHYLQQTRQPVLPILQKNFVVLQRHSFLLTTRQIRPYTRSPVMVNGFDCQYFKDIKNLPNVWPEYGQNKQSVGELWLGFLDYYSNQFNFDLNAVTISQTEPLARSSNECISLTRAGSRIAIHKPFQTNDNLGRGLSDRMSDHIIKTFRHWQKLFNGPKLGGTKASNNLTSCRTWKELFENSKLLEFGPAPQDRLCHRCGVNGHISKNCPTSHNSAYLSSLMHYAGLK